jgi:hypothetical protein
MKKHLLILAGLTIMFGAHAADEAPAAAAAASGAQATQARGAKISACRKAAIDQGLKGNELKQAILACTK